MAKPCRPAQLLPHENVEQYAHKVADAVEVAWHRVHGAGRLEVPVTAVATLAAVPARDSEGRDPAVEMITWSPAEFAAFARHTWRSVIRARPETTHLLHPLIAWLFGDNDAERYAQAHAVAIAALKAGQLCLTGTVRRLEVDLLGTVLTVLRPASALQGRGQYYTPSCVTKLMARMNSVGEGSAVTDPAMGTGGMFRAVAEVMREQHLDPRTITWVGCDVDELGVACATVNSMIWQLGSDIVFHAGNSLTDDWESRARAQRDELRSIASDVVRNRQVLTLLRGLDTN